MKGTIRKIGAALLLVLWHASAAGAGTTDPDTAGDRHRAPSFLLLPPARPGATRGHYGLLTESLANGSLTEAEIIAKRLVENSVDDPAGGGFTRPAALHNLAVVQHAAADYASAILNYEAAIELIAARENRLSPHLVSSLHGLALALADSGDPVAALQQFDRALHVNSVNEGPHSLSQVPLLDALANLHDAKGDVQTVSDILARIYSLHVRAYAPRSPKLLPVLYRQAAFYRAHDMFRREYDAWLDVLDIQRAENGAGDLSLVEPQVNLGRIMVRGMNKVTNRSGPTAPSAEKYLKRAMAIAMQHPDADWRIQRTSLLAIADYYTLVDMDAQARTQYGRAWDLLTGQGLLDLRAADLEQVVPLSQPHPHPYANFRYNPDADEIDTADYRDGVIVAEFTINRRGRAEDIRIVEADPPGFDRMEWRLRTALKDFVYRPRLADGRSVARPDVRYRLDYHYLDAEYRDSQLKSRKTPVARTSGVLQQPQR